MISDGQPNTIQCHIAHIGINTTHIITIYAKSKVNVFIIIYFYMNKTLINNIVTIMSTRTLIITVNTINLATPNLILL